MRERPAFRKPHGSMGGCPRSRPSSSARVSTAVLRALSFGGWARWAAPEPTPGGRAFAIAAAPFLPHPQFRFNAEFSQRRLSCRSWRAPAPGGSPLGRSRWRGSPRPLAPRPSPQRGAVGGQGPRGAGQGPGPAPRPCLRSAHPSERGLGRPPPRSGRPPGGRRTGQHPIVALARLPPPPEPV